MAEPIDAASFADALGALGPFERPPHVAIAASGGADSTALVALTAAWLRKAGGRGTVLTVDHGLRPAAADEAAWVAFVARRFGLEHQTLRWMPAPTVRFSQATARAARYGLLDAACREAGCLHLLVAHQATDQALTIAMRRRRGFGPGVAGMSAVRELDHCRLLRPLLRFPRARIEATARGAGFGWIEDPTNRDTRYERARLAPDPGAPRSSRSRIDAEARYAAWLARHLRVAANAALEVDGRAWRALSADDAARLLATLAASVGGPAYRPSSRRAASVLDRLREPGTAATLGRCIIGWRGDRLTFRSEADGAPRAPWALAGAPFAAPDVVSDTGFLI